MGPILVGGDKGQEGLPEKICIEHRLQVCLFVCLKSMYGLFQSCLLSKPVSCFGPFDSLTNEVGNEFDDFPVTVCCFRVCETLSAKMKRAERNRETEKERERKNK